MMQSERRCTLRCSLCRCWSQEQLCASLADAEGEDISAHVDTQGIFQLHAVRCSSGVTNVNIYPGFYAAPMSPCTTIQQPAYDPLEWSNPWILNTKPQNLNHVIVHHHQTLNTIKRRHNPFEGSISYGVRLLFC
jgi:hypothetical protein